jgi:L-ascorbate metabolism protein UlaG (beta-lactamase superfamily)
MKVQWFGQSAFLLVSDSGLRVITDPYDPVIGYGEINEAADVVTMSHEHRDHNYIQGLKGNPVVLKGAGTRETNGVEFRSIATSHDKNQGKERGNNTVFCFVIDGVRVCHLGDLGHFLAEPELKAIGLVDLLLVPVGGFYTIDDSEATEIVAALDPRITIPMHYRTEMSGQKLATVENFLKGKMDIIRPREPWFEIKPIVSPQTGQYVVLPNTR